MLSSGFDIETVSEYKVTGNTVGFWIQPRASHSSKYTYMCTATHRHTQEPTNASRHTHTQKEDMHIHMRSVEGYLEAGKIVETVKVLIIPAW